MKYLLLIGFWAMSLSYAQTAISNGCLGDQFSESNQPVGVLLREIQADSPLQDAGLQPGDVVISLGAWPIAVGNDLGQAVRSLGSGVGTTITFLRKGATEHWDIMNSQVMMGWPKDGFCYRSSSEQATATTPPEDNSWIWSLTPSMEIACYGNSRQVTSTLRVGPNVCMGFAKPHPKMTDLAEVSYIVRLYYLAPVGTLLNPKYEARTKDWQFTQRLDEGRTSPIRIPVYVPENDIVAGIIRIFSSTSDLVANGTKALGAYFAVTSGDYTGAMTLAATTDLGSVERFFNDTVNVLDDLLASKNRPYAVRLYARMCNAQTCTPWNSRLIERQK